MIINSFRLRLAALYAVMVILIFSLFIVAIDLGYRKVLLSAASSTGGEDMRPRAGVLPYGGRVDDLERLFLISFPFAAAAAAVAGWFLAGRSLAPLVRIKSALEGIRYGSFEKGIDAELKGWEVDDLAAALNDILDSVQRSLHAQERFISDVSHEIRSPLTSLLGGIGVALMKRRTPEEYEELLGNNLSDIMRLTRIAENMLFLARADNNTLKLREERIDLNEILRNTVEGASFEGLSLTEEYSDNVKILGDGDLLGQAFSNLVNNAVKYTPQGGTITMTTERNGDSVFVTIRDTGIGIPEEDVPHIFERFYRVDRERSRKSGGTGLGLAITREIISAHKGRIIVKSTVGGGSDFVVIFPAMTDQGSQKGQ